VPWPTQKTPSQRIDFALAPDNQEIRDMLSELLSTYGKPATSKFLGVPILTLRRWFENDRRPSHTAAKGIWCVWAILLHPELLKSEWDVATWGRFQVRRKPRTTTPSVANTQNKSALRPYRKRTATMDPLTGEDWTI